jgi:hypothetical protein
MFSRIPKWTWWLASPLLAVVLVLGYFRYSTIPLRRLDYQVWSTSHPEWARGASDDSRANHWWVFARARVDYIMMPEERLFRTLGS